MHLYAVCHWEEHLSKSSLMFGADSPQQHASYAEEVSSRPSRLASTHTSLLRLPTNHPTTDHTG